MPSTTLRVPGTRRSSTAVLNEILRREVADGQSNLEVDDLDSSGSEAEGFGATPSSPKSRANKPVKAVAAPFPAGVDLPSASRFTSWGLGGFAFVTRESVIQRLFRWPLLIVVLAFILLDFLLYLLVRFCVLFYESVIVWRGKARSLRRKMHEARTYEEFKEAALALDSYLGNDAWKTRLDSLDHDMDAVSRTARRLDRYRARNDLVKLQDVLLHGALKPNHGGVENTSLYSHTFYGTKQDVEHYVQATVAALEHIAASSLPATQKRNFFRRAAHMYGRSALALSGGAGLGYYHLGILDVLVETGNLPDIISGTSAGSLIAAMIGVRTIEEIKRDILTPELHKILKACSEPWIVRIKRWFSDGALFDVSDWYKKLSVVTGEITFLEAFQKTGRVLNVSVVPEEPGAPPKLLNYLTAPDVLVASAVLASSAVPGILNPVELLRKTPSGKIVPFKGAGRRWRDGSLRVDIPEGSLHKLYNVNYSVVSQVNPHVGLFFFDRQGAAGDPTSHRGGKGWRGGFLLATLERYLKLEMIKNAQLIRDMNLLPRYMGVDPSLFFLQNFEGSITIVPHSTISDYIFLLDDPDRDRLTKFFKGGRQAAYPKIHAIENRLRIEQAIVNGRARAKKESKEEGVSEGERSQVSGGVQDVDEDNWSEGSHE